LLRGGESRLAEELQIRRRELGEMVKDAASTLLELGWFACGVEDSLGDFGALDALHFGFSIDGVEEDRDNPETPVGLERETCPAARAVQAALNTAPTVGDAAKLAEDALEVFDAFELLEAVDARNLFEVDGRFPESGGIADHDREGGFTARPNPAIVVVDLVEFKLLRPLVLFELRRDARARDDAKLAPIALGERSVAGATAGGERRREGDRRGIGGDQCFGERRTQKDDRDSYVEGRAHFPMTDKRVATSFSSVRAAFLYRPSERI
jgi:hypothetical protein